jgi:hypothetical protein
MTPPHARHASLAGILACGVMGAALLSAASAPAHVNPSLVLLSDRDAMAVALPGAVRFADRRIKLTSAQKETLQKEWRFKADEGNYRIHEGRDAGAQVVGTVVFLTQATIHSPVRLAVGVGNDGRVTGAALVEVSQESYPWVKPLLEQRLLKRCVGLDAHGDFEPPEDRPGGTQGAMEAFYAKVITRMVQWGAALCETAGLTGSR